MNKMRIKPGTKLKRIKPRARFGWQITQEKAYTVKSVHYQCVYFVEIEGGFNINKFEIVGEVPVKSHLPDFL